MKVVASRSDLLAALDHVKRVAVPGTGTFLETLLLRAEDGTFRVTGVGPDVEATVTCAAAVEGEGSGTVPAETFGKMLRRSGAGEVTLTRLADPGRVEMASGRARATLPSLERDAFLFFAATAPTHRFAVPASTLAAMIRDVAFAAPEDEGFGGNLYGVCLFHDAEAGRLGCIATDTRRLAMRTTSAPPAAAGMPRILMAVKAAQEIGRLAEAAGAGAVEIATSPAMLEVEGGGVALRTRLIDMAFPFFERAIPQEPRSRIDVASEPLRAALARAELVTNPRRGSGVRLDIAGDAVTVTADGAAGAGFTETVPASFDGGSDALAVSAPLARGIIETVGAEALHIEVGRERKYTIWRRPGDDALTCLLMPRLL